MRFAVIDMNLTWQALHCHAPVESSYRGPPQINGPSKFNRVNKAVFNRIKISRGEHRSVEQGAKSPSKIPEGVRPRGISEGFQGVNRAEFHRAGNTASAERIMLRD
jgi:hypothetical protein